MHLAILTGQIAKRLRQLDVDTDNVGRQANDIRHTRRHADLIGDGFGHDVKIGDDPRLAGVDHVVAVLLAAKHLAVDEAHLASAANPASAVMGQLNAIHQCRVEQQVAAIRQKGLVV